MGFYENSHSNCVMKARIVKNVDSASNGLTLKLMSELKISMCSIILKIVLDGLSRSSLPW